MFFGAQEVFKDDVEARGVGFPKYQPVASHGDPIQPQNYTIVEFANSVVMLSGSENDDVATRNLLAKILIL